MNILLDTQITVWAFTNDKRLSAKAREIILSPQNILFFSSASVIEVDWKTKSKNNNLTECFWLRQWQKTLCS